MRTGLFLSLRRLAQGLVLALVLLGWTAQTAFAWDIWLVTNQQRILKIRDVDGVPTQEWVLTHDLVPGGYQSAFGDFSFAPNGVLYGISMTLGEPSRLYTIDLEDGHLTPVGDPFPFEWGNALYFDWQTGRGWVGGGLESWQPYELLHGFYAFDHYDPGATFLWYDMRPDYPQGGFTGDFAEANGFLYAIWGQGHMYAHTSYLLQITLDAQQNLVGYTNLGAGEDHGIPEGLFALASDGHQLFAVSPLALYRVTVQGGEATYTRVLTFDLRPDEQVYGATVQHADLEVGLTVSDATPHQGDLVQVTVSLSNAGPYGADGVEVQITLPPGLTFRRADTAAGTYDPNQGRWTLPWVEVGASPTLTLTLEVSASEPQTVTAEIVAAGPVDPDSSPKVGVTVDDYADGVADDDEASLSVLSGVLIPVTGFPRLAQPSAAPLSASTERPRPAADLALEIPALGVWAPVVGVPLSDAGWDVAWLGESVGWLQGSAFPTWPGNTVLTGHVWDADNTPGVFYRLRDLRFGDRILLHLGGQTATYVVRENRLVLPAQMDVVWRHFEGDWLTLVTCAGYQPEEQDYRYRRLVRAVRVDRP